MERVMKRPELARKLAQRTGFYIKNMEEVLKALDDVIVEHMSAATEDEPSEMYLSLGFKLGGRYEPEREVRNPQNGETVMTAAKYIPYARFSQSFRNKINKK